MGGFDMNAFTAIGTPIAGAIGQHQTNAKNMQLARETRAWQEAMLRNQMQFRVADLKAAGLNPILAAEGGGGGVPSPPTARVENEVTPAINAALTAAQIALAKKQAENVDAQTVATQAQARKTNAEAGILEPTVAHSAENARVQAETVKQQLQKLSYEVNSALAESGVKSNQYQILQPLLNEYQRLVNEGERLGLSEKKATAEFFKNVPHAKFLELLRKFLPRY